MARKQNTGDGLEGAAAGASKTGELVVEARGAIAAARESFSTRNDSQPSAEFIAHFLANWLCNNEHRVLAAFREDSLR